MAKLLSELTKEELEILAREQAADICVLVETKKKVLEKNKKLAEMVIGLESDNRILQNTLALEMDRNEALTKENYYLVKKLRDNGLI